MSMYNCAGAEALVCLKARGHYHEDVFGGRAPRTISSSAANSAIRYAQQDILAAAQAGDISRA